MRRRQAFAAQTAAREAALLSLKVGTPAKPAVSIGLNNHLYDEDGNDLTNPAGQALARKMDAEALAAFSPNACPKCGRVVTRGKFMHQKHCKGIAT